VDCSDAEIFLSIPYLLVLKSSLDIGKDAENATSLCRRFFPQLFAETDSDAKLQCQAAKFEKLKHDFAELRQLAGKDFFDIYCQIEHQILIGGPDTKPKPQDSCYQLLESQVQAIKEIGISLTRQCPQAWNEFMVVALGVPEDEPIPYLQQ
jgi:hypothetical protein